MNQHEILKEYLTALYRAEVVVTDNQLEPLCFNGVGSLTDYRIHLLDVELPAIACLREIRRKEEEDDVLAVSVREALLELQTIFGEEDGHATHRYLTITHEGMPVERGYLDCTERDLLEEYLRLQQASFLRQKKWFESRKIPLPFPGTLPRERHGHRRDHGPAPPHVTSHHARQQVPHQGIHPVLLSSMELARGEGLLHADQPHAGTSPPDGLH